MLQDKHRNIAPLAPGQGGSTAFGASLLPVILPYDMENHIVIMGVAPMGMRFPVGSPDVQFNMPCPTGIPDPDAGMQEIRSLMAILLSGKDDLQRLTAFRQQPLAIEVL